MELNQTLLMGKTLFEMRGDLAKKEPLMLKKWQEADLYHALLKKHEKDPDFMLHDGPPYANGDMHCGHMLNRILKDIVLRYQSMRGFRTPFYPGWDTHGLPIENAVTKSGVNRKAISMVEFRKHCETFAKKQVFRQMEQVQRLGILADFDQRYETLQSSFEAEQIHLFSTMAMKGFIFKGLKPVYYSPSSESALAEAEIEYKDIASTTIYVAFPVSDGKGILSHDCSFVIWTTTPWTIPANLAISLSPTLTYGVYDTEKGSFVFLTSLAAQLQKELQLEKMECKQTFLGKELEGIITKHPLYDRNSPILVGNHVTDDAGTGCVHTAPGHGEDDFIIGKQYGLPPYCPVDEHGKMDATVGERLQGLFYEKANEEVVLMLEEVGALLKKDTIVHAYPHDWRTGKPLIFRATPQWFCSIDSIRETLLTEIDRVQWTPSWGKVRMHNMIKERGDWCISRQRAWGVPIPIFYDNQNQPIMDQSVFDYVEQLIRASGSNIWFEKEAEELLPASFLKANADRAPFKKETDIMDVWFDSGSSFAGVVQTKKEKFPVDLYLEGSDQYRGWFNSSLILSVATQGVAPYQAVVSHGFVLDGNGNKMSKSLGNGLDPNKIIQQYGVDILRLYVATIDYQSDVRISEPIIKQVAETYRKIRNTFKFMLANLSDGDTVFQPETDRVTEFHVLSTYVLAKLEAVKNETIQAYQRYDFASMMQVVLTFLTQDISAFYCSVAKDSLYCDRKESQARREYQTVLYEVLITLTKVLAPVLCFTMEEVYQNLPERKESFVALETFVTETHVYQASVLTEYEQFASFRSEILKALEQARSEGVIGSSLEANVKLCISPSYQSTLFNRLTKQEMEKACIISGLEVVVKESQEDLLEIEVVRHSGEKCERCWTYYDALEMVEEHHVCSRCKEVIANEK